MEQLEARPLNLRELSHDIRNSLYIVKGLLEQHLEFLTNPLVDSPRSGQQETQAILQKSTREINRVLTTISRLNRIAAGDSSRLPQCGLRSAVSVKSVLRRLIEALKREHYLDRLILVDAVSSSLPRIEVSSADLEEIFFNLIVNAAQAMGPAGQLIIDGSFKADPLPSVSISLRDNGHGIPDEVLPHLFEPFSTGRVEKGGSGIGLYIVKELVERNGGGIAVRTRHLLGTTFTVTYPAVQV